MSGTGTPTGFQEPNSTGSDYAAHSFLIGQMLKGVWTSTLVKVVSCTNAGGVSPVGSVDVVPLVDQVDGAGNATPHTTIHGLPYMRLQGGSNAVILDPVAGDIGIALFAHHDISSAKASKGQANPGSRRRNDPADGMYLGGVLNGAPTAYVRFSAGGVEVVSPMVVTLTAPNIVLNGQTLINGQLSQGTGAAGGGATLEGPVTVINNLTAQGTSVHTHVHPGVQRGSAATDPPA